MTNQQRTTQAKTSLTGLALADAFGESYFGETEVVLEHIRQRTIPAKTTWEFTDDTVMAIPIYHQLRKYGKINQDELAKAFAANHDRDPNRGYGATARRILREISQGGNWRGIAPSVFEGMGSMGNGASMRVGPIGAYWFDDLDRVKALATQSAEVTHSNIEGITGAIAVATAAALATRVKVYGEPTTPNDFIEQVAAALPDTDTRAKVKKSTAVPYHYHIETVKTILGNGTRIMAQDTVPYAIWWAAHNLTDYEESLWKAVSVLGDRDTICAIVGSITVMSSPAERVPAAWAASVESIETSPFT